MLTNDDFKIIGEKGLEKVLSLRYLYKYISLNDALNYLLKENTFKFSDPTDFNDPFDCSEQIIKIIIDKENELKFLNEAVTKYRLPRKSRRQQIKKLNKADNYFKVLKAKKKEFKVNCFSEISDEILMWSHYANKHKGVCVKFELDIMRHDYVIYPVNYISEINEIDGMTNTPYIFYYLVTTKSSRWAYEKEVRAITKTGNSIISFPKESIKEIIFGCNVKESEIEKAIKYIRKLKYKSLIFSKMELDPKVIGLKKRLI